MSGVRRRVTGDDRLPFNGLEAALCHLEEVLPAAIIVARIGTRTVPSASAYLLSNSCESAMIRS